jgi:hypothetical protein
MFTLRQIRVIEVSSWKVQQGHYLYFNMEDEKRLAKIGSIASSPLPVTRDPLSFSAIISWLLIIPRRFWYKLNVSQSEVPCTA